MQATLTASILTPSVNNAGLQQHAKADAGRSVNSAELLNGHKTVEIQHNGAIYRLQATRLGKLILTK
ncbi:MAG TPA: hemin uptake protein HemP [Burkholderiaceae bacterium]